VEVNHFDRKMAVSKILTQISMPSRFLKSDLFVITLHYNTATNIESQSKLPLLHEHCAQKNETNLQIHQLHCYKTKVHFDRRKCKVVFEERFLIYTVITSNLSFPTTQADFPMIFFHSAHGLHLSPALEECIIP
jgi:hypothetical protein